MAFKVAFSGWTTNSTEKTLRRNKYCISNENLDTNSGLQGMGLPRVVFSAEIGVNFWNAFKLGKLQYKFWQEELQNMIELIDNFWYVLNNYMWALKEGFLIVCTYFQRCYSLIVHCIRVFQIRAA